MAVTLMTKLTPGKLIPFFELPSAFGGSVSLWNLKAKKNMVLAFIPNECPICDEFLYTLTSAYYQYETENTQILVIVCGDEKAASRIQDEVGPPFPILYDADGRITGEYTDRIPAVFVADKFGELRRQFIPGPGESLPSQKEILDVVELINLECPE